MFGVLAQRLCSCKELDVLPHGKLKRCARIDLAGLHPCSIVAHIYIFQGDLPGINPDTGYGHDERLFHRVFDGKHHPTCDILQASDGIDLFENKGGKIFPVLWSRYPAYRFEASLCQGGLHRYPSMKFHGITIQVFSDHQIFEMSRIRPRI